MTPPITSDRRIVLLDLDGTLVDKEHRLTVPGENVRAVIDRLQAKNTLVGLNSDTALLPLRVWALRLGLKGPLIAEKGQVVALSPVDDPVAMGVTDYFHQLKQKVILAALENFEAAFVGVGDITEFIREGGHPYGVDRCAILINGYRRCSFSAYALGSHGNRLVKEPQIFDRFCDLVVRLVGHDSERLDAPDINRDYGIVVLHEKGASKSLGVKRLMRMLGEDIEYLMIGDADSDIIQTQYPTKLCAVNNASPGLKDAVRETAGIVSSETFTKGVLDLLVRLNETT